MGSGSTPIFFCGYCTEAENFVSSGINQSAMTTPHIAHYIDLDALELLHPEFRERLLQYLAKNPEELTVPYGLPFSLHCISGALQQINDTITSQQ